MVTYALAGLTTLTIITFKIYLILQPMVYLEMNHEYTFKLVLIGLAVTASMELGVTFIWCNTLCANQKLHEFKLIYKLDIGELEGIQVSWPLAAFHSFFLILAEGCMLSLGCYKQRKHAQPPVALEKQANNEDTEMNAREIN